MVNISLLLHYRLNGICIKCLKGLLESCNYKVGNERAFSFKIIQSWTMDVIPATPCNPWLSIVVLNKLDSNFLVKIYVLLICFQPLW